MAKGSHKPPTASQKPDKDIPRHIKWELACLARFSPVVEGSIKCDVAESGLVKIYFEIETDFMMHGSSDLIADVEPIIFSFLNEGQIGKVAPSVYAGRPDFPRHISHINPGGNDTPPSLCLARSGLQSIYDIGGIEACLERLLEWLNDAKTGSFYEHGWEPVPGLTIEKCVLGYTNPVELQEYAAAHPEGGFSFSTATLQFIGQGTDNVFVQAALPLIDREQADQVAAANVAMAISKADGHPFHTGVPMVFAWPARDRIEEDTHFGRWRTIADIKNGLQETGLYDFVDEAFIRIHAGNMFGDAPDADKRGNKVILLVVGLWRPAPLDPTIVGLSQNADARHLELRTFYLERPVDADAWSNEVRVRDFYGQVTTTPETLEAVSGESAFPNSALLGVGALGSAFVDYAVRGGTKSLTVIDNDILLSHNIARHRALNYSVRQDKVKVAAAMAESRAQDVVINPHKENFVDLSDTQIAQRFENSTQIIDTTANPLVRRRLAKLARPPLPILRSEIFNRGLLGVSYLTWIGHHQNLNMLHHQLIASAMENDIIKEWLAYEASRTFKDEELLLGFGCSSLTTKMPHYKVDIHASTAFAIGQSKLQDLEQPTIILNPVGEDGLPKGAIMFKPPAVTVFRPNEKTSDWTIIVDNSVLETLHVQRQNNAPNETGGYLFGSMDEDASHIYIVAASPEPPGTVASPTAIKLGRWGRTGFEKAFMRRTRRRLPPIGTWHSHPSGSPDASAKDKKTVDTFKAEDMSRGLPTLMGITGMHEDAFFVLGD